MSSRRWNSRTRTVKLSLPFVALGVILPFVSGVVLVPLYLRFIPSTLYGAWLATGNVLAWLTLVDPGIATVLQQRIATAYGARDFEAMAGWIGGGIWASGCVALVITFVGFGCVQFLPSWLNLPMDESCRVLVRAFQWSVVASALMVLGFALTAINQGLQSSIAIGTIYTGFQVFRIVLTMVMLQMGAGLMALSVPSVVVAAGSLVAHAVYLGYRMRVESFVASWERRHLQALGKVLTFTALGRIAAVLATNIDLFLVARMLGPDSVSMLKFTRSAPETCRLIVERPYTALHPALAHLVGTGNLERAREILARLLRASIWLVGMLIAGFAVLNEPFVRLWVGSRFFAGGEVSAVLVAGVIVGAIISVLSGLCLAAGNIAGTSLTGIMQAITYILLLWVGGRWFGLFGVAAAALVSVVLSQAWYLPFALVKAYALPKSELYALGRSIFGAAVSSSTVAFLFGRMHAKSWVMFAGSGTGLCITYFAVLCLVQGDARVELKRALAWLKRRYAAKSAREKNMTDPT